jgi:hypothetical protein
MVEPPDDAPPAPAPGRRRNPPILTTRFRKTAIGLIIGVVVTAVLVQTAVCYLFVRGLSGLGE